MQKRRVVVTGIGALTPLGNTVDETWQSAKAGKSGIGPITRFDASLMPTRIAGEVRNFDPTKFIDIKEVKKQDLYSQYAIAASDEAWKSAGFGEARCDTGYDPKRMGCILGIGIGGITTLEKYHAAYLEGGVKKISPFLIPGMISNLGPGNVAIKFGLQGINYTITSACTSATHAIGEAYRIISDGLQDMVVTGGSESAVGPTGIGGFCAMKALSTRNDDPTRASRPFDKDRDGFVLAEGAAILVVESLEGAQKRGANILAEIVGYGFSCDAFHITAPKTDGAGAIACMTDAIKSAGISPKDVGYVNAHGTSTPANDSTESLAIKSVFGDWAKSGLLVSSTKSMTGHLLGAAGAVEAMFSIQALREGIVPPTINLENPGEGCDLDYVPHEARQAPIKYAISNSFGFGGTNATVVLGKV